MSELPQDYLSRDRTCQAQDTGVCHTGTSDLAFHGLDPTIGAVVQRLRWAYAHPHVMSYARRPAVLREQGVHYGDFVDEQGLLEAQYGTVRQAIYGSAELGEFTARLHADLDAFDAHLQREAKTVGRKMLETRRSLAASLLTRYMGSNQELRELCRALCLVVCARQGVPMPLTSEMTAEADRRQLPMTAESGEPLFLRAEAAPSTRIDIQPLVDVAKEANANPQEGQLQRAQEKIRRPGSVRSAATWLGDGRWEKSWSFAGSSPFVRRGEGVAAYYEWWQSAAQWRQDMISAHPIVLLIHRYAGSGFWLADTLRLTDTHTRDMRIATLIADIYVQLDQANNTFAADFVNQAHRRTDWSIYKPILDGVAARYYQHNSDPLMRAVRVIVDRHQPFDLLGTADQVVMGVGIALILAMPFGAVTWPILAAATIGAVGVAAAKSVEAHVVHAYTSKQAPFADIDPFLKVVEERDDRASTLFFLALEMLGAVPFGKLSKLARSRLPPTSPGPPLPRLAAEAASGADDAKGLLGKNGLLDKGTGDAERALIRTGQPPAQAKVVQAADGDAKHAMGASHKKDAGAPVVHPATPTTGSGTAQKSGGQRLREMMGQGNRAPAASGQADEALAPGVGTKTITENDKAVQALGEVTERFEIVLWKAQPPKLLEQTRAFEYIAPPTPLEDMASRVRVRLKRARTEMPDAVWTDINLREIDLAALRVQRSREASHVMLEALAADPLGGRTATRRYLQAQMDAESARRALGGLTVDANGRLASTVPLPPHVEDLVERGARFRVHEKTGNLLYYLPGETKAYTHVFDALRQPERRTVFGMDNHSRTSVWYDDLRWHWFDRGYAYPVPSTNGTRWMMYDPEMKLWLPEQYIDMGHKVSAAEHHQRLLRFIDDALHTSKHGNLTIEQIHDRVRRSVRTFMNDHTNYVPEFYWRNQMKGAPEGFHYGRLDRDLKLGGNRRLFAEPTTPPGIDADDVDELTKQAMEVYHRDMWLAEHLADQ